MNHEIGRNRKLIAIMRDIPAVCENNKIKRINNNGVPILLVEQNAKQALETADKGYVLVDGSNKVEGAGQDLINDRNVARMFLGSKD